MAPLGAFEALDRVIRPLEAADYLTHGQAGRREGEEVPSLLAAA